MRLGISIKSQAKKKRLRAENSNPDAESFGPLISERGKQCRRYRHHYAQNRQFLDVVLSDAAKDLFLVATSWSNAFAGAAAIVANKTRARIDFND